MKTLVRLLAGLVLLIAVLAGIGMLLPREVTVERWTQINAPASEIYPLVANLEAYQQWSPWANLDPDATYTFGDIPEGVGATMTWASDSPDVGNGSMEITEATENAALTVALNFGDMGGGTAFWEFEEAAGTTTATWRLVADMGAGPIGRWLGLKMDDWVGADFVPRAVQRHQPVHHARPAGHPQDDRKDHAHCRRPIGQGGVVQVVRSGPDIQEDQRPEMDDRQAIRIDRSPRLLGHEVIHHRQKAGGEEEPDRVVAVPPLHQGILNAGKNRVAFEEANGNDEVIADVEQGDRRPGSNVKPNGDVEVVFAAAGDRPHEVDPKNDPDQGDGNVDGPFQLRVLVTAGDAQG